MIMFASFYGRRLSTSRKVDSSSTRFPSFAHVARHGAVLGRCAAAAAVLLAAGCTTTTHTVPTKITPVAKTASSESEYRVAEVALNSGNIEMARTVYGRLAAANPTSVEALTGLGNTLYVVGDYTRAAVYFSKAHQLAPEANEPMVGIARCAIHQRDFKLSIKTYKEILAKTPDDPVALAGLGVSLAMTRNYSESQKVLRRGLLAHPGDPLLSIDLGLSLVLSGNPQEGANVLLDVTRYPEAPPQARQNLALAYGLMGNDDAAAAILSQDLPKASVQNNLRFYQVHRTQMDARPVIHSWDPVATSSIPSQLISPQLTEAK